MALLGLALGVWFGPIMLLWFLTLAAMGLVNVVANPGRGRLLPRSANGVIELGTQVEIQLASFPLMDVIRAASAAEVIPDRY